MSPDGHTSDDMRTSSGQTVSVVTIRLIWHMLLCVGVTASYYVFYVSYMSLCVTICHSVSLCVSACYYVYGCHSVSMCQCVSVCYYVYVCHSVTLCQCVSVC